MDRNAAFVEFLETLNPEQRHAVEQIEGPVLVLAGPGTGKTQVIAARIGNILLRTDARPQNILCLTFTDAATHAMRKRLVQLIGPDAHRVPIMTFHAFCNRVIQEHPEFFGRTELQPATELERIQIVRQLLDALDPEHPLRAGYKSPYQLEKQILNLFATMKSEHWKAGHIVRLVDEWERQLPDNEQFIYQKNTKHGAKGSPKTAQIDAERDRMGRLRAAADLYPKYVAAMQRAGRYDYEDMLLWVLRVFEKQTPLLRTYQERFQYLLVDEYQDTNGAQNQLLHQLADYWEMPNICIVGDDDQSIYEFQGARLQNLLDFYEQHRAHLTTVVLGTNYRATQMLLDAAQRVITQNQLRAAARFDPPIEKQLTAASTDENTSLQLQIYANRLSESAQIAHKIGELVASGTPPEQIAVLYYRHRQGARVADLLAKRGIPFATRRPANLLRLPLIRHLLDLLHYAHESVESGPESADWRLFRLLHAPFWGIDSLELARLAGQMAHEENPSWRTVLANSSWPRAGWLARLPGQIGLMSLPELLEHMLTESGLLAWILEQTDRAWHLQVLMTWQQFVQEEALRHREPLDLGGLLHQIEVMESNDLSIGVQQAFDTRTESAAGSVQLLTIHSAKGLEFEHVFLLDCVSEAWDNMSSDSRHQFKLPPTITKSGEEDAEEARRRLFFVGLTRAKRHLYVSWAMQDDSGKPLHQSRFVDELLAVEEASLDVEMSQIEVPAPIVQEAMVSLLGTGQALRITLTDTAILDELLSGFVLSVHSLNLYLRCPLAFYYEVVLRVPGASSHAALYGQAMHGALQAYFGLMQRDAQRQWPDPQVMPALFTDRMLRLRSHFNDTEYTQSLARGRTALGRYAYEQVPLWRKRARAELHVPDVLLANGARIKGTLDRIEYLDDGSIRIVDYKTGLPDPKKTAAPDEKQPNGGPYWRQLAFYKILLEASPFVTESVSQAVIGWVEPDKKGSFQYHNASLESKHMQAMDALILEVWTRIQERDFATGCGAKDCVWCQMLTTRSLEPYRDRPEDELDEG
jgi:DNA helicase II / ATP-dependent DNA helicase PcrA